MDAITFARIGGPKRRFTVPADASLPKIQAVPTFFLRKPSVRPQANSAASLL
jgi:hypothetical protein